MSMDPLEEQLRQLSIINNRVGVATAGSDDNIAAKYMGGSKVAALVSSLETAQMTGGNGVGLSDTYNTKKVGPLVPPKPHKKKSNIPEIPQSSLVKQVCEPLYSQRLQCVDAGATNDAMGRAPLLLRKQPIYAGSSLYDGSVSSKVTLDNPAILDQQLEALAHHKKQLERKALFLQQQQQEPLQQQAHTVSSIPKLSSTSLLNVSQSMKPHQPIENNLVYTNVLKGPHIKAGSECAEYTPTNNIYCNVLYEKSVAFEDEMNQPKLLSNNNDATEYDNVDEDEVPSPPSPVSSSYSELRRATNVFAATAHPLQQQVQQSQVHFVAPLDVATSSTGTPAHKLSMIAPPTTVAAGASAALQQQTYMNMHMRYNNEYNSYSPSLQSISQDSSDYYGYGSFSQGTSTYESIYEPINPRPPSQSSIRSNYLMYAPYINGGQLPDARGLSTAVNSTCGSGDGVLSNSTSADLSTLAGSLQSSGANTPLHAGCGSLPHAPKTSLNHQKEAEVEALTDFLVHSMDAPSDADIYGICYKCNERVLGETSGCTAMDQIYHITCFTCSECQINLQGKPFYALEGKPYCEYDYLQTLEKCSVCMKPILERILRATGKPYHPQCFQCVVCGKSLDGIPFTVDATNQNYCIADFHKKFAPRCCVCKEPIMPEPGEEETVRVVALDRSFHFECYKCEDCGLLLSSEAEGRGCYPLDNHVLCKSCNAKRVQMLTNRMTTEL